MSKSGQALIRFLLTYHSDIISSTGDLPFIADQEADNVRLQREKEEAKVVAKELHGGLDRTTQSLNNLMASYANPLRENNTISSDNVAIEQRHTKMRAEAATYTCEIRTMTTKIREMEEQSQAYKIENTKLRNHLTKLGTELEFLRLRVRALESGQVQGRIPDNAVRA